MSFALRIVIMILLLALVEFYFVKKASGVFKILFPGVSRKGIKYTTITGLIWVNLYPLILVIAWTYASISQTGRPSQPESFFYEYLVLYPFWVWILIVMQSFIILLPIDIIKIITVLIFRKSKSKIKSVHTKIVIAIIVLAVIYVPLRTVYDLNSISTRVVEYAKENLHHSLNGFKITLIADVQADQFTTEERLQNYINKVNETDPDLVLIAGDIVTGTPNYIKTAAEYLGKIKSRYGVYTCVGDHDNWAYRNDYEKSVNEITKALAEHGIKMIDNDKITLNIDSAKVGITFVTNTYVEIVESVLLDSLTNGTGPYDLRIFLTHQPRDYLINEAIDKDYDLMFAGHTHGGQITLFFPFYNLSPTLLETEYVKGDFWFDDMLFIVNRGLGVSLAPVRYNSTPEVTSIILRN